MLQKVVKNAGIFTKKIVEFFAATDYKTEKVAATPNINDSEEKKEEIFVDI